MFTNLIIPSIEEPDTDFNRKWNIRPAEDTDLNFIANSWTKSFQRSPLTRCMSSKEYFEQHAIFVEKMLQTSFVYLAVGITDKDIIFGWICGEEYGKSLLIHYIYTRKDLRKIGIATELLNYLLKGSQQWISTAITEDGFSFVKKRNGTFDTLNLLVR